MLYLLLMSLEVKWSNYVWLTLNCIISSKQRKASFQLLCASLCSRCHWKTSAGSLF